MTSISPAYAADITRRRAAYTWVLAAWAVVSVIGGVAAWRGVAGAFWGAFGLQSAVWGVINAGFAAAGLAAVSRHRRASPDQVLRDRDRLLDTLRFNHKMNFLWVGGAVAVLVWGFSVDSRTVIGHGSAAVVQALFLAVFDRRFDRGVRPAE